MARVNRLGICGNDKIVTQARSEKVSAQIIELYSNNKLEFITTKGVSADIEQILNILRKHFPEKETKSRVVDTRSPMKDQNDKEHLMDPTLNT